jgi:hypothetical protein
LVVRCKRYSGAIERLFTCSDESANLAQESAQSCLAGLARFNVSGEAAMELKPHSDRAVVRMLEFNFQPRLLTAGSAAEYRQAA